MKNDKHIVEHLFVNYVTAVYFLHIISVVSHRAKFNATPPILVVIHPGLSKTGRMNNLAEYIPYFRKVLLLLRCF